MSVYTALRISAIEKPLQAVITLVGLLTLSRLLTPSEIGVQVLAAAVMLLAAELKNFGIGGFIIRHKSLSKPIIQNTFTISFIVSSCLGGLLLFLSDEIGQAFSDERVSTSISIIAITFFFVPFMSVTSALLSKNFEFKKLAIARTSEIAVQNTASIVLALYGFGYLSLPIGMLIGNVATLFVFILFKPALASFRLNFMGIKSILLENLFITLNAGVKRLIIVLPEVLIGYFSTAANAALFSRGFGIVDFGISTLQGFLGTIVSPYLARENTSLTAVTLAFTSINKLIGVLMFPLLIGISMLSDELIHLMLGDQWYAAADITSIIAIAMIFKFFFSFYNEFFITIKKDKVLANFQTAELFLLGVSCTVAAINSIDLIPYAILGTCVVVLIGKLVYFQASDFLSLTDYFNDNKLNYMAGLAIFLVIYAVQIIFNAMSISSHFLIIFASLVVSSIVWFLLLFLGKHPLIVVIKRLNKMSC
jgi:O-antigen/teichoic acid export membrane protein